MSRYAFIAATVALTVYAQLMIKWRALAHAGTKPGDRMGYLMAMYTDPGVLSGLACALGASVLWALAIERTPLTIAYPFMAVSFALVPLASVLLFREGLSGSQVLGILLIIAGVGLSAAPR
ncbi:MAG: hypothetical protein NVSMB18_33520 [Acetobacteraceae bacterium]